LLSSLAFASLLLGLSSTSVEAYAYPSVNLSQNDIGFNEDVSECGGGGSNFIYSVEFDALDTSLSPLGSMGATPDVDWSTGSQQATATSITIPAGQEYIETKIADGACAGSHIGYYHIALYPGSGGGSGGGSSTTTIVAGSGDNPNLDIFLLGVSFVGGWWMVSKLFKSKV